MPTIKAITRYPLKGFSGERQFKAALLDGQALAFDRAYAIENGPSPFDPASPRHLPKIHFLMLMRNEQLAGLVARFDDTSHDLTLEDGARGVALAKGCLGTEDGRGRIEDFLQGYLPETALRGRLRIVASPGHSFSDVAAKCLHVINLESVRALETMLGVPIDPRRFRANLWIDGLPAWSELDMVGKSLHASGGARLMIFKRTERCAATNVDPATAARDLKIPSYLSRTLGHTDFGVYVRVEAAGDIAEGMQLRV